MLAIRVRITAWTSDDFPGFVECRFDDAYGVEQVFREKAPVVTCENIDARSAFPRPAVIACEAVGHRVETCGRTVWSVSTVLPWGVESTDGRTEFDVLPDQLTETE